APLTTHLRIQVLNAPPLPRCWFLNASGTQLIQVQRDRFAHNWRKVGDGDAYPRYERMRDAFKRELEVFETFLTREALGELVPNQCEVTYVNHIIAGDGWARHGQIDEVLTVVSARPTEPLLGEAEDVSVALRYVIADETGAPTGRLHVV